MPRRLHQIRLQLTSLAIVVAAGAALFAADRPEITFADGGIFPESVTSSRDGTLFFGSLGRDSVYRAVPDSSKASVWIQPKASGLITVLGVYADEAAGRLWVCASTSGGRGTPVIGETALKAFNLANASPIASYPFPGGGLCNDVAVAPDGTLYVTDTTGARVLRLKKGATALEPWATDRTLLNTADGVALLADGQVYVNSVGQGTLVRIAVKADGSAGPITKLETSRALKSPDGMRWVGPRTLLLVEGEGRLDEVTINGNRAEVKVLKEGLAGPTAVTLAGGTAYVTEARLDDRNNPKLKDRDPGPFRAVGVPYTAPR